MRCCATCRGHRSLHWHRSRFPANGAAPRGGRRLSIMGLAGRDGFAGDAVNPSVEAWPRHPCRGHPRKPIPPGHGQFPCRPPRKRKRRSKAEADRFALHPRMAWIYRVDQGRHLPTAAGICRRRGGSDGGGVSRMDAATKPPRTDSRRPPPSDPPRQPAAIQLLLLLLLLPLQVQGCKPCKATTSPSLQSPAGPGSPATAAASATPGSSHPAGPATAATPATAPPRCNRAHPRAARH